MGSIAEQHARAKSVACPSWCRGDDWHDAEDDAVTAPLIEHGRDIAGGFLPQVRRLPWHEGIITRPLVGSWEVSLRRTDHMADGDGIDHWPSMVPGAVGWVEDEVVTLEYTPRLPGAGSVKIPLLPGEALELARALTRASDVASFEAD